MIDKKIMMMDGRWSMMNLKKRHYFFCSVSFRLGCVDDGEKDGDLTS